MHTTEEIETKAWQLWLQNCSDMWPALDEGERVYWMIKASKALSSSKSNAGTPTGKPAETEDNQLGKS